MSDQALVPIQIANNDFEAKTVLEEARIAHEKYLICRENFDFESAINNYIDVIKLDPTIPESYYRLALLLWEKGQIDVNAAIEQCKTAITLCPHNINAHIYAGYFLKLAKNYDEAEALFRKAIKISKRNSARPRLFLSMSILQRIRSQKPSLNDFLSFLYYFFSGSLMICWDNPSMRMIYKNFSSDLAVFAYEAIGQIFEKIRFYPFAIKVYETAAKHICHNELFYDKMGDLAVKCKDYSVGIECYKRVIEANPNNRDAIVKVATVMQTFCPDNVDEIIDYYNLLLTLGGDNTHVYYELGHLYLSKNDKIHAISAFKLALEGDSENPFYNNSLAYSFVRAELYDDAIIYYQRAIKLNPDKIWTSIVCHALGSIYGEIHGNFEAAIATFQAGIILDPNNYDLQVSLGDIFMASGDIDKAIRAYCDAIKLEPENYKAYSKAGLALWEKDFVEESIISYHKAINLNPEFDIAHNNLGVVYLDGIGEPAEALECFEKAIDINPNYTLAYFNAGRAAELLGQNTEAANYFQMALDLNKLTNELNEEEILDKIYGLFNL